MTETLEPALGMYSFGKSLNPVAEISGTTGPGGSTFMKGQFNMPTDNLGGTADPGGTSFWLTTLQHNALLSRVGFLFAWGVRVAAIPTEVVTVSGADKLSEPKQGIMGGLTPDICWLIPHYDRRSSTANTRDNLCFAIPLVEEQLIQNLIV